MAFICFTTTAPNARATVSVLRINQLENINTISQSWYAVTALLLFEWSVIKFTYIWIFTLRNKFFEVWGSLKVFLQTLGFSIRFKGVFSNLRVFQTKKIFHYQYTYCFMSQLLQYNNLNFLTIQSHIYLNRSSLM